jgi:hypothetical protein
MSLLLARRGGLLRSLTSRVLASWDVFLLLMFLVFLLRQWFTVHRFARHGRIFLPLSPGLSAAEEALFLFFWANFHNHTLAQFSPKNKARNRSCPFSRAERFLP